MSIKIPVGCILMLFSAAIVGCGRDQSKTEPRTSDAVSPATSLRLVTWNIQKCEGGIDAVTRELRELRPDVVLLQEVIEPARGSSHANQTQQIASALQMRAISSCGRLDEDRRQCIAVLSRFPIRESWELSTAADRAYALAAKIDLAGASATVVSVHLTGTWKIDLQHASETITRRENECHALADWVAAQKLPLIVAGDFNPVGQQSLAMLASGIPEVAGVGATFPSAHPAMALDRVFASRHWSVSSVRVIDSRTADHRPVAVELVRGK